MRTGSMGSSWAQLNINNALNIWGFSSIGVGCALYPLKDLGAFVTWLISPSLLLASVTLPLYYRFFCSFFRYNIFSYLVHAHASFYYRFPMSQHSFVHTGFYSNKIVVCIAFQLISTTLYLTYDLFAGLPS